MTINEYIVDFASLNTNKRMGQIAPHKAIMLLSVIDLIETKKIKWSCFGLTEELEEKFHENWKRYVGVSILFKPIPATPFYHLCNEPFWRLYNADGSEMMKLATTPSLGFLRDNGIRAEIDEELFDILRSSNNRAGLRTLLISTYLSKPKTEIKKVLPIAIGYFCASWI